MGRFVVVDDEARVSEEVSHSYLNSCVRCVDTESGLFDMENGHYLRVWRMIPLDLYVCTHYVKNDKGKLVERLSCGGTFCYSGEPITYENGVSVSDMLHHMHNVAGLAKDKFADVPLRGTNGEKVRRFSQTKCHKGHKESFVKELEERRGTVVRSCLYIPRP